MKPALANALAALMLVSGGCLVIPTPVQTFRETDSGKRKLPNVDGLVGDAGSPNPIRPGATRETVETLIGPPDARDAAGAFGEYQFTTQSGIVISLISGPCSTFGIFPLHNDRDALLVGYDARGNVRWTEHGEPGRKTSDMLDLRGTRELANPRPRPSSQPSFLSQPSS